MRYRKEITLKDGSTCCLRHSTAQDVQAVLDCFNLTHEQTDWLLSYPDESSFTVEREEQFLQTKADSENEVYLLAEVDGTVAGTAGINRVGGQEKLRHRAEMGISIDRTYWGLGIGPALVRACIQARPSCFPSVWTSL